MKQWKQIVWAGTLACCGLFVLLDFFMCAQNTANTSPDRPHQDKPQKDGASKIQGIGAEGVDMVLQVVAAKSALAGQEGDMQDVVVMQRRDKAIRGIRRNPNSTKQPSEHFVDTLEENFEPKSVIHKLWKGNVSAHLLSPQLQMAMQEYMHSNKHSVNYRGHRRSNLRGAELLCDIKRGVRVRTLNGKEPPFSRLGWEKLVPQQNFDSLHGSNFKTCAVVISAGSMLNSSLGKEIDAHDAVIRFNAAPTEGFKKDVGKKTTIRVINSQIVANPMKILHTSPLYKDVILVAWDPAPYTVSLERWFQYPDYDLFTPYVKHRKKNPAQPFYILHPEFLWQLWDIIQGNMQENIQPNPPSSGFIGIILMMALCTEVHVYEYIPSKRSTDLCHYYDNYYDAACTYGAYHPLLYEKMLIQRINTGSTADLERNGKVTLPGFSTVACEASHQAHDPGVFPGERLHTKVPTSMVFP